MSQNLLYHWNKRSSSVPFPAGCWGGYSKTGWTHLGLEPFLDFLDSVWRQVAEAGPSSALAKSSKVQRLRKDSMFANVNMLLHWHSSFWSPSKKCVCFCLWNYTWGSQTIKTIQSLSHKPFKGNISHWTKSNSELIEEDTQYMRRNQVLDGINSSLVPNQDKSWAFSTCSHSEKNEINFSYISYWETIPCLCSYMDLLMHHLNHRRELLRSPLLLLSTTLRKDFWETEEAILLI